MIWRLFASQADSAGIQAQKEQMEQDNVSVNSKPDHPPGIRTFSLPGVGFSQNFLCPGGRAFELEKFSTVLK